ncbi:MAG: tetratricopeptide repeat protein [Planctomycetota bacterium]
MWIKRTLLGVALVAFAAAQASAQFDDDPAIVRAKETLRNLAASRKITGDPAYQRARAAWPDLSKEIEEQIRRQNEALDGSVEDITKAKSHYAANALTRGRPVDHYLHGRLLGLTSELESAYDEFKQTLSQDLFFFWAWDGIGVYHVNKGNWRLARDAFERVLILNPDYRKAAFGIVQSYTQEGDVPSAVAKLHEIIGNGGQKLEPDVEIQARLQLADLFRRQGQPAEAIKELDWVEKNGQKSYGVHAMRAVCARSLERWSDAVKDYRQMLALDPDNFGVHFSIGLCYAELGRNADAKQAYEDGLKAGGDRVDRYSRERVEEEVSRLAALPAVQTPDKRRLTFDDYLHLAKNSSDLTKRRNAILTLSRAPVEVENVDFTKRLLQAFLEGLKDPDHVIVAKSLEQVATRMGSSTQSESIRNLVGLVAVDASADPRVRSMAYHLLTRWDSRKVVPVLVMALRKENDVQAFRRLHESLNVLTLAWIERVLPTEIDARDVGRLRGLWEQWYKSNRDMYRKYEPEDFNS